MVIRTAKQKRTKQVSTVSEKPEADDKYLVPALRKEIDRLQRLIAKKQVAHESEIYKLRAEFEERKKIDRIEMVIVAPGQITTP